MSESSHRAGNKAAFAFAPGRVELLGNHTDYNQGVVLGVAIDRGIKVSGSRREDAMIVIRSCAMGEVSIACSELRPLKENGWANYPLGVANELIALSVPIAGFTAEVSGDLPAGLGLSSSAALELATALFLLKLFPCEIAPLEIAKACQRAEHRFVGVQSGLVDQVVAVFGRADHAVFFDSRTEEVLTVPFSRSHALIVTDSGKRRALIQGDYNRRREETRAAAEALQVRALRDVSSAELARRADIPDLLRRRARHIVEENERVWRARDLLQTGDVGGFGALMNASHESSRTNFENSTPELDLLVSIAQRLPGVLGARLTGAGFGGATITLCERSKAEAIALELSNRYCAESGTRPQAFIAEIAAGTP
jgi:galactokinase